MWGFETDLGLLVPFYEVDYTRAQLMSATSSMQALYIYWGLPYSPGRVQEPIRADLRLILEEVARHGGSAPEYLGTFAGDLLYTLDGDPVPYTPAIGNRVTMSAGGFDVETNGDFSVMYRRGTIQPASWGGRNPNPVTRVTPVPRAENHAWQVVGSGPAFPGAVILTSDGRLLGMTMYTSSQSVSLVGKILRYIAPQLGNGPLGGYDRGYDRVLIKTLGEEGGGGALDRYNPRTSTSTIGAYPLTRQQVNDFRSDLWTNNFAEGFLKAFTGTGEGAVLGLRWFPGLAGYVEQSDVKNYITVGNMALRFGSNSVKTYPLLKEYVSIPLGNVEVPALNGSYLDYTEARYVATLPFVGAAELSPDDVVGRKVHLLYMVNMTDGAAMCYLSHEFLPKAENMDSVFFTASCTWGEEIPLAGEKVESVGAVLYNMVAGVVGLPSPGNMGGSHSVGAVAANSAYMGDLEAKIVAYSKTDLTDGGYAAAGGLPSARTATLGNLSGFVRVSAVTDAGSVPARHADAIIALLKEGVYL